MAVGVVPVNDQQLFDVSRHIWTTQSIDVGLNHACSKKVGNPSSHLPKGLFEHLTLQRPV